MRIEADRLEASGVLLAAKSEKDGPRRFTMLAYTGVPIGRYYGRLAIDLQGIERDDKMAMLLEHDDAAPVAVCTEHKLTKKGLELSGYFLSTAESEKVQKLADEGFPWKASIGIRFLEHSQLEADSEIELNGQTVKGPATIVRRARLFETSFITCNPADLATTAEVMRAQEAAMTIKNDDAKKPEGQLSGAPVPVDLEAAIAARLTARREELTKAFPKNPDFAARMLMDGKTVEQAWQEYAKVLEQDLAKAKEGETLKTLKAQTGDRGLGFSASLAEGTTSHELKHLPVEERARIEVGSDLKLQEIFRDIPNKTAAQLYASALKFENARRVDGTRLMDPRVLRLAAEAFDENCDPRFGPLGRLEGHGERLGSYGKAGPDYSSITVKGFLGQFYASFEQELAGIWAPEVGLRVESNQETETHKWLGFFPQLSEWLGGIREDGMPVYSFAITNKLYRASVGLDKNDFKFQKFGLINMRIGEAGAIAAEHWNALVSTLIEANGKGYDNSNFFATDHALGGSAPAAQSNLLDKATYGGLSVADTSNVSDQEMAKAIQVAVPHMQTWKSNNNQPMNGGMRRVGIMVPTQLVGAARAAIKKERMDAGASNALKVQDLEYVLIPNPRLTAANVFYVFRLDSNNKPFILQEPGPPETLWQGPGSYLEWIQHKFGFGIETTRAAGYGAWESSLKVTLG